MARIAGVDLPNRKKTKIAMTYLYGIGHSRAREVLEATGVDGDKRVHELTEGEITELRRQVEGNYIIEGELRRKVRADIDRLKEIKSYRGRRHSQGLPTRGQNTRSNARSWKGPRPAKAGARRR